MHENYDQTIVIDFPPIKFLLRIQLHEFSLWGFYNITLSIKPILNKLIDICIEMILRFEKNWMQMQKMQINDKWSSVTILIQAQLQTLNNNGTKTNFLSCNPFVLLRLARTNDYYCRRYRKIFLFKSYSHKSIT